MISLLRLLAFLLLGSTSFVWAHFEIVSPSGGNVYIDTTVAIEWKETSGQPTPDILTFQLFDGPLNAQQPVTVIVTAIKSNIGFYEWYVSPKISEGSQYTVSAGLAGARVFSKPFSIIHPDSKMKKRNQLANAIATNTTSNSTTPGTSTQAPRANETTQVETWSKHSLIAIALLSTYLLSYI
ncbi:hypothetical protein K7432_004182 [Basidiobolus ranarum]|uniref:Yeast cell wall synthesis Kre9/Knh1-like N-terminal domain-containing protein n=1 Tax=Basidiobolus ranarum TaxID=34480 RepID=A0ABR2WYS4_9FUNG